METPTNRELKIMLNNQADKFAEKHEDLMRVSRETRDSVKEILTQTTKTNGRVSTLETWSKDAQKVIEHTTILAENTLNRYRTDRVRIWTAISVLAILGGAIISLSVMAINSKIKDGIAEALSNYQIEVVK